METGEPFKTISRRPKINTHGNQTAASRGILNRMRIATPALIFWPILLATVFIQPVCAANQGESISYIRAQIIKAYGGKKILERTVAVHAIGHIDAFMRQDRGSYGLFFKRPRKLFVETRYQRSSETRILNGDTGYRTMNNAPLSKVNGYRLLSMVYQYKHFDLPYGLLQNAYKVTFKGKEALNGRPVLVLHLADKEGPPMDAYVDAGRFLIVKVTGHFVLGPGMAATLSSEFSDFRKVDGAVFPFKVTYYAGGMKIAQTVFKSYQVNPPIPDSLFKPGP